jgi:adenylate cyclase
MSYDLALRLRPATLLDTRIALVTETEEDLQRWGYPLSDDVLAQILERLGAHGARVIGVDKYRDIPVPPGTERLTQALKKNPDIVWVTRYGGAGALPIPPPRVLQGSDQVGFNDLIDDPGGIVRRGLLFLDDGQNVTYSFPLALALHYLKPAGIGLQADPLHSEQLRLSRTTVPPFESNDGGYVGADAAGYQFLLDYAGMPAHFKTFSITELLSGKVTPEELKDRIVIVGTTAKSINDYFYTPFSQGQDADQRIYGVELFGHAVSQLLRFALADEAPIKVWRDGPEYAWTWLWCLLGGLAGFIARALRTFLLAALLGISLLGSACYLAFLQDWWIPVVPPLLGFLLSSMSAASYMSSQEKRQRAMLMQIFSRHVSDDVAQTLWEQRDQFLQGNRPKPQQITATVLFSDIRGFTTISEQLPPQLLMEWLNEYMEAMAGVVARHHGVINKYIGDAVMALFGAPIAHHDEAEIAADAVNAVECALAMEQEIKRLNPLWVARGLSPIGIRIGIFTGPLVAGSLGGSERLEYTVIGDSVNVASRLESYNKDFTAPAAEGRSCRILIGESTLRLLGGHYHTEAVGEVALKGKDETVSVYQVIGRLKQGETS